MNQVNFVTDREALKSSLVAEQATESLIGELSFEGSTCVFWLVVVGEAALVVGVARRPLHADLRDGYPMKRRIHLPVSPMVQPELFGIPRPHRDGGGSVEPGERRLAAEASHVGGLGKNPCGT